jgi:hypothetical protein
MRKIELVFTPDPDTIYVNPSNRGDELCYPELCKGLLVALDQEGNPYALVWDQTTPPDGPDMAKSWHQYGTCCVVGPNIYDRVEAACWALRRGWRVWRAVDGIEAQAWLSEQLMRQRKGLQAEEVAMV